MRLRHHAAAAAIGGLVLAVTVSAGTASAANGRFYWEGPKGAIYYVQNPPDSKCLSMGQEARAARNDTKQPLSIYSEKNCKGTKVVLTPGQRADHKVSFASVKFNSR
ncbi:hypothetical protein ACFP1Z_10585 [Streptomyces gamaensis]|uniref:Secreted protein n=1 Tax=Streptomyces gamaensis TaxID=1763542 RepID=A0ABW0YYX6_9ACTN